MKELSRVYYTLSYDNAMSVTDVSFGRWLSNELDKRDWSQSDLARHLSMGSGVISNWISGTRRPSYDNCLNLARVLVIDPDVVLQKAGRQTPRQVQSRARSFDDVMRELEAERPIAVPIVEQVASAGLGAGAIGYVYLPPINGRRPRLFAMRVTGECMAPRIMPGDTIIVDPEAPPEIGKTVVAVAGVNWDLVLVKRLIEERGRRVLQPENPACGKPVVVDETVRIVGVVIKIIRDA